MVEENDQIFRSKPWEGEGLGLKLPVDLADRKDEPSPVLVSTISKKCYEKLADEFRYLGMANFFKEFSYRCSKVGPS